MGIKNLLPNLKNATKSVQIRQFSGCVAAIDAYAWIHKAIYASGGNLFVDSEDCSYVDYCVRKSEQLISYGIKPIFVFDGRDIPAKDLTNASRRQKREENKEKMKELIAAGKDQEARAVMGVCVDVTYEIAFKVIVACRQRNIDYIVAPYEADAQIVYLLKSGIADFAIAEDSDLLVFGCKFLLTKLNRKSEGEGELVIGENILDCFTPNFDMKMFRRMCILSGCDYLQNIKGIGLKKAENFFRLTARESEIHDVLPKLPCYLKMKNVKVTQDYINGFIRAENTFKYQVVFCPINRKLVPLNEYEKGLTKEDVSYAGEFFDNELAFQFAIGNIDFDMQVNSDYTLVEGEYSIWSSNFRKRIIPDLLSKLESDFDVRSASQLFSISPQSSSFRNKRLKTEKSQSLSNENESIPISPADNLQINEHLQVNSKSTWTTSTFEVRSRYFCQSQALMLNECENLSYTELKQNREATQKKIEMMYLSSSKSVVNQIHTNDNDDCDIEDIISELESEKSDSQTSSNVSDDKYRDNEFETKCIAL